MTSGAARIVIVGLGDLGDRLATALADCPEVGELVLGGRQVRHGLALAHRLSTRGRAAVRFVELDALDVGAVAERLTRERPHLLLQCASLLSPWAVAERSDPFATALRSAGFALQLPAQLPILIAVMRAARAAGMTAPVVNCSYPDVTHPILSRLGLAPTIGVGNVGMIHELVGDTLRRSGQDPGLLRVVGHHAHVTSAVTCDPMRCGDAPLPRVYLGDAGVRADALAFAGIPVVPSRNLNALTARHAVSVVRALLPDGEPRQTSAPGPSGLPGGFPVTIRGPEVKLDLPPSLSLEEAIDFQAQSARLDGIETIEDDGTVRFTEYSRHLFRNIAMEVAAPLHPDEALARFGLLSRALEARAS